MIRWKYIFLGLLSIFIIHSIISAAQYAKNIVIRVKDADGNIIPSPTVTLKRGGQCGNKKLSEKDGFFKFSTDCWEQPILEVKKSGYDSYQEDLSDKSNEYLKDIEITLKPLSAKPSFSVQTSERVDKKEKEGYGDDVSKRINDILTQINEMKGLLSKQPAEKIANKQTQLVGDDVSKKINDILTRINEMKELLSKQPSKKTTTEETQTGVTQIDDELKDIKSEIATINSKLSEIKDELFEPIRVPSLLLISVLIVFVIIGHKIKTLETNMTKQITKIAENMNNAEKPETSQSDISDNITNLISAISKLQISIEEALKRFEKAEAITEKLNLSKKEIVDSVINEMQNLKIPVHLTQSPPSSGYVESQPFSSHISVSPLQKEKAEYKKFLEQGPTTIASKFCYLGSARKDSYNPRFLFSEENSISQCHYILFYKNSNEEGWIFPNLKDFSIAMRTLFPGLNYDTSSENITPVSARKISSGEWVASTP